MPWGSALSYRILLALWVQAVASTATSIYTTNDTVTLRINSTSGSKNGALESHKTSRLAQNLSIAC